MYIVDVSSLEPSEFFIPPGVAWPPGIAQLELGAEVGIWDDKSCVTGDQGWIKGGSRVDQWWINGAF